MKVTQANYPQTTQLGDVTQIGTPSSNYAYIRNDDNDKGNIDSY